MEKFIPYQKLSKAKQKELNKKRRGTWGNFNPTTRTEKNLKIYNRKKFQKTDYNSENFGISFYYKNNMNIVAPKTENTFGVIKWIIQQQI